MGEWSDYFEDLPEENPANYDENGRYDPNGTQRHERTKLNLANQRLTEVLKQKGSLTPAPKKK
ncbi:hypothetical protein ACSZNN_10545 [Aeromonas hydrophila]